MNEHQRKRRNKKRRLRLKSCQKRPLRRSLMAAQEYKCYYCACYVHEPPAGHSVSYQHPQMATLDHIVPVSKGGTNQPRNFVVACYECNAKRRDNA